MGWSSFCKHRDAVRGQHYLGLGHLHPFIRRQERFQARIEKRNARSSELAELARKVGDDDDVATVHAEPALRFVVVDTNLALRVALQTWFLAAELDERSIEGQHALMPRIAEFV